MRKVLIVADDATVYRIVDILELARETGSINAVAKKIGLDESSIRSALWRAGYKSRVQFIIESVKEDK